MKLLLLLVVLYLAGEAYGHAALFSPKPWWWAPSRARPCGGANYTSVPRAIWPVGSNQTVTWSVIAGDGMGELHARIDVTGKVGNFSNGYPVGFVQPKFTKLKHYDVSFIVPNVECKGVNKTCTMQFWTDSGGGWYSCTTIQIVCTGCQGGIPISRDDCVVANDLDFCSSKDGHEVLVPDEQTAKQIDSLTKRTYEQNYPNPLVFANGNSTECKSLYKEMMCELYLSPCGNSTSSYSFQQCQKVLSACNVTTEHQYLYNCSVFPVAATPPNSAATSQYPLTWLSLALCIVVFLYL
jgi:hypothetical protein